MCAQNMYVCCMNTGVMNEQDELILRLYDELDTLYKKIESLKRNMELYESKVTDQNRTRG